MAAGGATMTAAPFVMSTAQCDDKEDQMKLYGAVGATVAATTAIVYWGFIKESADVTRVTMTPKERQAYLTRIARAGSDNPDRELDNVRAQFGKALRLVEGSEIPLKGNSQIEFHTDEGTKFSFPGNFFDANEDKKLDFSEFLVAYMIISEFFRAQLRSRKDIQKVMFVAMDKDGNGSISLPELTQFIHVAACLGVTRNTSTPKQVYYTYPLKNTCTVAP